MQHHKIVTIQDISCFGQCSLTVALPIISAMGVETAIIPTAVLSTHTGGFKNFTFRDLSCDIPKISEHWKSLDLNFDVVYTGYLGSFKQISYISDFIDRFKTPKNTLLIDPVMGDNGNLYSGFTPEFAKAMTALTKKADIIVPNITEAAVMLGENYVSEGYNPSYIHHLIQGLAKSGSKNVVLTGVSYSPDKIGAVTYSAETDEYFSYFTDKIGNNFHGTGDIFSSVVTGALAHGLNLNQAVRLAVDFVPECIKKTLNCKEEHWYGVKFEDCIPQLITMLSKEIQNKN